MRTYCRLLSAATLILVWGCTQESIVFRSDVELTDKRLSFSEPQVFDFRAEQGPHDLELEMTFAPDSLPSWKAIPFYYIHTDPEGKESEGKFNLPIRDNAGGWAGGISDNGERQVEAVFASEKVLAAGFHQIKLYGDNPKKGEPIPGIVRLTFKVVRMD